jgi:hypothetical protein
MSGSRLYDPVTGQLYLSRVANLAPKILRALLDGGELTRDAITKIEQKIQDFLRAVFLPFVGQWDVPGYIAQENRRAFESLKPLAEEVRAKETSVNFIGAHYRSRLSVRGRRTAFASRPEVFHNSLTALLGQSLRNKLGTLPEASTFQQLWDAVYLEQYFRLCGVGTTFSEWALQRKHLRPIAILTNRGKNCTVTLRTVADNIEVPTVEVSRNLTRQLLRPNDTKSLWRAVAEAIIQTLAEDREAFEKLEKQSDDSPSTEAIRSWLRMIHRANTLASHAQERIGLRFELAARAAYVTGLVLYGREYREFQSDLLRHFEAADPGLRQCRVEETSLSRIGSFVSVLQSLRLYQDCYGEGCITVPYGLEPSPGRNSAGRNGSVRARRVPGSRCSVTLFWDLSDSFPLVLPTILSATPSLFSHAIDEAEKSIVQEAPTKPIEPPSLQRLAFRLQRETKNSLAASAIAKILSLSEDLSRCLHEGKPRAFTFLLGSSQWLISDLNIEHELVGASHPFYLTSRDEKKAISYASTLALLEGNSSFLQAENLALFVAWPGEPLEVTHVVRLPRLAGVRRKLLCDFTIDRPGLLAVMTHGNGRGEVIYEGRVRGILRGGQLWKEKPPDYEGFEKYLLHLLNNIVDKGRTNTLRAVLQPVIRDLSEEVGEGALFVVARRDALDTLLEASSKLTDVLDSVDGQRLGEMSPDVLYQLARDDGATLICGDTLRVWGRRHLPTSALPDLETGWKSPGPMNWKHWYRTKTWGTRKRTGLAVSYGLRDNGIVIAISADGPVDVLVGGKGVAEYRE